MKTSDGPAARPLLLPRLHAALAGGHAGIERILVRSEGRPTAKALHDLRVALRRTAALAKLTRGIPSEGDGELLRKAARDLRRALSPQRTYEVSCQRLQARFRRDPAKRATALVLSRLLERQAKDPRKVPRQALAGPLSSLRRAFAAREADLSPQKSAPLFARDSRTEKKLCTKIASRLERKRRKLVREGVPTAETLHPTRIRLKDLRYALEFVKGVMPGVTELLPSLKSFQTAAGDANDRFELSRLVEALVVRVPRTRRGGAESLLPILSKDAERALKRAQQQARPVLERLSAITLTFESSDTAR
ncbi:MAG: CHAD domain-containing protein [Thermoanaerobaculia bacterium]